MFEAHKENLDHYFDLGYVGIAATSLLAGGIPLATVKLGEFGRTVCWILIYLPAAYVVGGIFSLGAGVNILWAVLAFLVLMAWHVGIRVGRRQGLKGARLALAPLPVDANAPASFVVALLEYAEILSSQHKDVALLDLRSSTTRTLHLLGAAEQRVRLGDIALSAAQRTHRMVDEASILIDDLGWANFEANHPEQAEENISDGVNLIEDVLASGPVPDEVRLELITLLVKALRHRSGMTAIANLPASLDFLAKAEELAAGLPPTKKFIELAGLDTAYAYVVAAHFDATYSPTLAFSTNSAEAETLKAAIARASRSVQSYESVADIERAAKAASVRVRLVKRQGSARVQRSAIAELDRLRLAAVRNLV